MTPENHSGRFDGIPKRNVFGLRQPQPATVTNAPVVLPKLTLEGIATILGYKLALLKEEAPAEPGGKARAPRKEISLILKEGQREGNVEVLAIDEQACSVKVNHRGTVLTLTFDS